MYTITIPVSWSYVSSWYTYVGWYGLGQVFKSVSQWEHLDIIEEGKPASKMLETRLLITDESYDSLQDPNDIRATRLHA